MLCEACRTNDNYRFAYGCSGPCDNTPGPAQDAICGACKEGLTWGHICKPKGCLACGHEGHWHGMDNNECRAPACRANPRGCTADDICTKKADFCITHEAPVGHGGRCIRSLAPFAVEAGVKP